MKAQPYLGITGATTADEARAISIQTNSTVFPSDRSHLPMQGFLVSAKTLSGESTTNRRYPPVAKLPELLASSGIETLRMIHYNSRQTDSLSKQIQILFDPLYNSALCRSLQLNIPWPPIAEIGKIKESFADLLIVLQISRGMLDADRAQTLAKKVEDYRDLISYALIDPSGGRGERFDLDQSVTLFLELNSKFPDLTVGFAGGLNDENVAQRAQALKSAIGSSNFSLDVEGGVRNKCSDVYGDDLLDLKKCRGYIQSAFSAIL
jgi:hypothetical protein